MFNKKQIIFVQLIYKVIFALPPQHKITVQFALESNKSIVKNNNFQ